jgi:hypothetical protein
MSINRNRSAAQKFIAETKQLGSVAVARVEAYKVYNSYGLCTRCFPHGQETINNKWRNAKGRKWNKRRRGLPLREVANILCPQQPDLQNNWNDLWEEEPTNHWLKLNPEYAFD